MGDCARIVFHSPSDLDVSPIVYLHSDGRFALLLIETALSRMRTNDASYSCARFIGECHACIEGIHGLGVWNLPHSEVEENESRRDAYRRQIKYLKHGDWEGRGLFLVDVDAWRITHAGNRINEFGDAGDGFGMQEATELKSVRGIVRLPRGIAGDD